MRCVRARPSLAVRWRHTNRDRPCEVCSCPYLFQWRSQREPWMREAWGAPSPDKPLKYSERRWGRERGRSIPFSEVTNEAPDFRLGGQSGLSASVARTAALDPQRSSGRIRGTGFMEYRRVPTGLLRLDVEGLDHLAPFFSFVSDELAEIGGRANERRAT